MSSSSKPLSRLLTALALSMTLMGCQAPSLQPPMRSELQSPGEPGTLSVAIRWPERPPRVLQRIPLAAEEAVLTVTDARDAVRATRRISRAAGDGLTRASLELPAGVDYRVSLRMEGLDGEVMAIAQSAPFAIRTNRAVEVSLQLEPVIMSVAGTGMDSFSGEGIPATDATFQNPSAVATDAAGNLYVAIRKNSGSYGNVIRKVSPEGVVTTVVGLPPESSEAYQTGDGTPARYTQLLSPAGLAVSPEGDMVIADEIVGTSPRINRMLFIPARDGRRFGKEMQAGHAYEIYRSSFTIAGITLGEDESVYASVRNWVVQVDRDGKAVTVAGIEGQVTGDAGPDGPATESDLKIPDALLLDPLGNLFIADRSNHRIRMLCRTPGTYYGIPMQAGWIYSIVGVLESGSWQRTSTLFPLVTGKAGLESSLNSPRGLALDDRGYLYISDSTNNVIRRLAPDGTLITVAGTGKPTKLGKVIEPLGDGGSSLKATLCFPGGLTIGPNGGLYVADSSNNLVRRIRI